MPLNLQDIIKLGFVGSGGSSGGGSSGGGGGSAAVNPKEVNFYDYDGTCVHAYTVEEAQALSELPAGPEHPGLVFQGWNWSLEGVKGLTRAMNIGAMYTTDDGTTRLYITLQAGRTSPMLGVGVNGTVTVDWGDGTAPDVLTGTNTSTTQWTPNHAYAKPGDYVIRLTVDGEMVFTGSSSSKQYACILRYEKISDDRNRVYQSALQRVELGYGVTSIGSHAFRQCKALTSISIHNGVVTFGSNAFYECSSLKSVVIPNSVTDIFKDSFNTCEALSRVALCSSMKNLGMNAFQSCVSIATMHLPDSLESIGSQAFSGCYALATLFIPNAVSVIESYLFNAVYGMACYDFTSHTSVPTLSNTNAFNGIPADCEIRVPAALYDEWIAATNWATYADRIKAY